uniref:Uncharacterized protein n=1 Tax=Anopheles farauti TaxID=69004 RepID=A0A182Q5X9_9DIPT
MESAPTQDQGIFIDETAFPLDDSGEIAENELLLEEDDENDITKDLDFSRTSPALFSLATPKRARMVLGLERTIAESSISGCHPISSSTPLPPVAVPSPSSSSGSMCTFKTPLPVSSSTLCRKSAIIETPAPEQPQTPWSICQQSAEQSKQVGDYNRQSIAAAIENLNAMTEEFAEFISKPSMIVVWRAKRTYPTDPVQPRTFNWLAKPGGNGTTNKGSSERRIVVSYLIDGNRSNAQQWILEVRAYLEEGSLEVMQSSPYCLATMVGGRQTLAPLSAEMSHTSPDSQSESCRQSSPYFRPYIGIQMPTTEMGETFGGVAFDNEGMGYL